MNVPLPGKALGVLEFCEAMERTQGKTRVLQLIWAAAAVELVRDRKSVV